MIAQEFAGYMMPESGQGGKRENCMDIQRSGGYKTALDIRFQSREEPKDCAGRNNLLSYSGQWRAAYDLHECIWAF